MSLFCVNECKFNNCGLYFANMYDLIQHIEETHVNADSDAFKKQHEATPNCIPISYLCRMFPQLPAEKAKPIVLEQTILPCPAQYKRRPSNQVSAISAALSFHPQPAANKTVNSSGGFIDNSGVDSDTISVGDESSLHLGGSDISSQMGDSSHLGSYNLKLPGLPEEKRYACPVANCNKRYKNINGVRMHAKTAHSNMDTQVGPNRPHKCSFCPKSYKTSTGLQNHISKDHGKPTVTATLGVPQAASNVSVATLGQVLSGTSVLAGALATPPAQPPANRNPPVTLISAPPSKGPTTIHVSPAPSPAPGSATIAAAVAGGHQYQSTSSSQGYGAYHHQGVKTSTVGGSNVTLVPLVSRSATVTKKFSHVSRHPQARNGQHQYFLHSHQSGNQSSTASNILETMDLKVEKNN